MTGSLSFARVEPVAEVDTCRGKSTAINLKAAKQIGLTVPPNVLVRPIK
jgi:hypothetical protein